jgi:hypothetical protein
VAACLSIGYVTAKEVEVESTSLGIAMVPREFECLICQRRFSRVCGDLILPEYMICDDCLDGLLQLEGEELKRQISERLAQSGSSSGEGLEDQIVLAVERVRPPSPT